MWRISGIVAKTVTAPVERCVLRYCLGSYLWVWSWIIFDFPGLNWFYKLNMGIVAYPSTKDTRVLWIVLLELSKNKGFYPFGEVLISWKALQVFHNPIHIVLLYSWISGNLSNVLRYFPNQGEILILINKFLSINCLNYQERHYLLFF